MNVDIKFKISGFNMESVSPQIDSADPETDSVERVLRNKHPTFHGHAGTISLNVVHGHNPPSSVRWALTCHGRPGRVRRARTV